MPYLSLFASSLLSLLCLFVLWLSISLEFGYLKHNYSSNVPTYAFIFVLLIQTFSSLISLIYALVGSGPLFTTTPIAAFCVLLVERGFDVDFGYFLRLVPKFLILMIVFSAIISIYTVMGFQIFPPTSNEIEMYFNNFGTGLWTMLMVLNGSNWPTPMMPAFDINRWSCIYFFLYIILVDWGVLNLVLGFVYLFFKLEQNDIQQTQKVIKEKALNAAFVILDVDELEYLSFKTVSNVVLEVRYCCFVCCLVACYLYYYLVMRRCFTIVVLPLLSVLC